MSNIRDIIQLFPRLLPIRKGMIQRCYNPNNPRYKNYGGRGIEIYKEWIDNKLTFLEWAVASGYKEGLTIERIDNNKGYTPENCRWATWTEQANNKESSYIVTYIGKSQTLSYWAIELNLPYKTLFYRLAYLKWSVKRAFTTPILEKKKNNNLTCPLFFRGESKKLIEWSKILNIPYRTLRARIKRGWSIEKTLSTSLEAIENGELSGLFTFRGKSKKLIEWAETTGIKYKTLRGRIKSGWSIEKALTMPIQKRLRKEPM